MPTYKVNFGRIHELAEKTRREADELEAHSKTSSNELKNNLNSWSGDTSNLYKDNAETNSNNTMDVANAMRSYADHLDETAKIIEEADDYCATAKI